MGVLLLRSGDNTIKVLSINLHFCASLTSLFFGAGVNAFLVIFGSKKRHFEGVNRAVVVIHLIRCITTTGQPDLERRQVKKRKKSAKKRKKREKGAVTHLKMGISLAL